MDTPKLNKMHPIDHCFLKKSMIEAYNKSIAIGSLKSLKTKIEWILCEVSDIIIKAIGGTFVKKK